MAEAITWDEYIGLARRYLASGMLDEVELPRKRSTEQELKSDREKALSHAGPISITARTENLNFYGYFGAVGPLLKWLATDDGAEAVRAFWARDDRSPAPPDDEVIARIRAFSSRWPRGVVSGTGVRLRAISVLLMALDAERYPPFKTTELNDACARVGYRKLPRDEDEGTLYEHVLRFFDRVIEESTERGLDRPSNRLEAQSVVWGIERDTPKDNASKTESEPDEPPARKPPPDLRALAKALLLDVTYLRTIEKLLDDKRQVIFQGPPGTGKTFVARELAACLAGSERVRLVQFHPSYAYEDFVQGFRPSLQHGQPGFELRSGPAP